MDKKELAMALKDMSDEEILALIRESRNPEPQETGYERAACGKDYYYEQCGVIKKDEDNYFEHNTNQYKSSNYYTNIQVAVNNIRADNLMRKLRRFAAEHGGCIAPCGPDAWYITYYYPDEAFRVKCCKYYGEEFTPGMILFATEQAAQDAIGEFSEELYWYFNFYEPMSCGFQIGR